MRGNPTAHRLETIDRYAEAIGATRSAGGGDQSLAAGGLEPEA
jgi:hypothetical protein